MYDVVMGFHMGLDGYQHRIVRDHLIGTDINWNRPYVGGIDKFHASLVYANYVFRKGRKRR